MSEESQEFDEQLKKENLERKVIEPEKFEEILLENIKMQEKVVEHSTNEYNKLVRMYQKYLRDKRNYVIEYYSKNGQMYYLTLAKKKV